MKKSKLKSLYFTCKSEPTSKNSSTKEPLVIGLSVAMGMAIVALIAYIVYNVVTKKRKKQRTGRNDNNPPAMEISGKFDIWSINVNTFS